MVSKSIFCISVSALSRLWRAVPPGKCRSLVQHVLFKNLIIRAHTLSRILTVAALSKLKTLERRERPTNNQMFPKSICITRYKLMNTPCMKYTSAKLRPGSMISEVRNNAICLHKAVGTTAKVGVNIANMNLHNTFSIELNHITTAYL